MPSIALQFHALPNELAAFFEKCASEMNLFVIAITFPPFAARLASREEIPNLIVHGPCMRLALREVPPVLPVAGETEFWDKNGDVLSLLIGRQTPKGLKQSWLGCGTAGPPISAVWKKIVARLRVATQVGAVSINPRTGATGRVKSFRFTPGAKALSDQGVPILPLAGGTLLKLGLPKEE